jgi:Inhibitor of Apoptosis domain
MNSDLTSDSIPLSRSSLSGTIPAGTDLKLIENRLQTYSNWPINYITPEQLAQAGFYYLNVADQVKCAFCGGIIGQWELNDSPLNEHRKFFPDCPIVRQQELQDSEIGIQSVRTPKSPEFSTLESRTRSFTSWDTTIQDPTILAQAGFFFLGTGDEVSGDFATFFSSSTC